MTVKKNNNSFLLQYISECDVFYVYLTKRVKSELSLFLFFTHVSVLLQIPAPPFCLFFLLLEKEATAAVLINQRVLINSVSAHTSDPGTRLPINSANYLLLGGEGWEGFGMGERGDGCVLLVPVPSCLLLQAQHKPTHAPLIAVILSFNCPRLSPRSL